MAKDSSVSRGGGIFCIFLGLILAICALVATKNTLTFLDQAHRTNGIVVEVERVESRNSDGITYRPTVTFRDHTGQERTVRSSLSSSRYNFSIGTEVQLLYDPGDPDSMVLDRWMHKWFWALMLGLFAVSSVIAGVTELRRDPRESRPRPRFFPR